jgi:hypothetical protein
LLAAHHDAQLCQARLRRLRKEERQQLAKLVCTLEAHEVALLKLDVLEGTSLVLLGLCHVCR